MEIKSIAKMGRKVGSFWQNGLEYNVLKKVQKHDRDEHKKADEINPPSRERINARKTARLKNQEKNRVKLFECLNENCKKKYSVEGDMMRFVKDKKEHTCLEPGCGKAFKYASKLQKHEESHGREGNGGMVPCGTGWVIGGRDARYARGGGSSPGKAFCAEPGCMKYFTNKECLEAHYQQHINCEICGSEQLKQNIKRHLQRHDNVVFKEIGDPMQL
ncbi:transcription factor IIIA [Tanacetum coccineum]